ncbi:transposase [Bergeyella porcorum]|uniref:transposase n=1 Tax=Bergeyella porcorum TaxID=1735111 RepID=UPI0035EB855F
MEQMGEDVHRLISKTCWVVERTFGSQKRWFGVGCTRLKGLAKVHTQHILEAIAYNLKRSPKMEIDPPAF